jgi:hypothetical protein
MNHAMPQLRPSFSPRWILGSWLVTSLAWLAAVQIEAAVHVAGRPPMGTELPVDYVPPVPNLAFIALMTLIPYFLGGMLLGRYTDGNRLPEILIGAVATVLTSLTMYVLVGGFNGGDFGLVAGVTLAGTALGAALGTFVLQRKVHDLESSSYSANKICLDCGVSNATEWTHCYSCLRVIRSIGDVKVRPGFGQHWFVGTFTLIGSLAFGLAFLSAAILSVAGTDVSTVGVFTLVVMYTPFVVVGFLLGIVSDGIRIPEIAAGALLYGVMLGLMGALIREPVAWGALLMATGIGMVASAAAAGVGGLLRKKPVQTAVLPSL